MSSEKPTPTIEDYLGVIYTLERDGKPVIGARLAELLEVSTPTVTITLKRMVRDNWISINDKKEIHLKESGLKAAHAVIRRHMLTEWLLARVLNVPWSQIHQEAHHIEHTISNSVEARMQAQFGNPEVCPHGNPLPGFEEISNAWIPLTEISPQKEIIIRRIHEQAEDDEELMNFLEKNYILPGEKALLKEVLDFNQTLTLEVRGKDVSLGTVAACFIYVELN